MACSDPKSYARDVRRHGRRHGWPYLGSAVACCAVIVAVVALRGSGPAAASPGYRVVYRIEQPDRVLTETLETDGVDRSRRLTRDEAGGVVAGSIVNEQGRWELLAGTDPGWVLVDPGRHLADGMNVPPSDLRVLAAAGLAEVAGSRSVLGHTCEVVRVREPAGTPLRAGPTRADHVDVCISAAGLQLSEVWTMDGRAIRATTAVEVDLEPQFSAETFSAEPRAATTAPASRHLVDLTEDIAADLVSRFDLPDHVVSDGGHAVVVTDDAGRPFDGTVVRFYRSGDHLATAEETESSRLSVIEGAPWPTPMGEGYLSSDLQTMTVAVALPEGVTVVLKGRDLDLLATLVDALER